METQTVVEQELRAEDGSAVSIRPAPEGEILETRDSRGRLLFEYEPATGRGIVHCAGDLRFQSEGTVEFAAKRGIRIETPKLSAQVSETVYEGKTLIVQGEKKGTYRINPKFSR